MANLTSLNQSLGAQVRAEQTETSLILHTEEAKIRIQVFHPLVIQVQAVKQNQAWDDFSYAVLDTCQAQEIQVEEQEGHWYVKTAALHLEIQKSPIRLRFFNQNGNLLNEDEPAFGISWLGQETWNYKKLQEGERFVGLGEKTGNLDRRGSTYIHWNTDQFAHGPESDPLYSSIPFYMGLWNGNAYGIFLDNSYPTRFDFGASNNRFSFFQTGDGPLRYYFIGGESVSQILGAYTDLTGKTPLPPLWSLGFQQCRYSYYPDTEIQQIAHSFRKKDIPADVLYLDIHYMDAYKVFTWDDKRFPNPEGLIKNLREEGFRLVMIYDPGIKVEEGYEVYHEGLEKNYFVKYPDGEPYQGQVWPGWCHFPDYTNPAVREWWADKHEELAKIGLEGFWNDMNEPAVWNKSFPDFTEFDFDGRKASHKEAHNVYGLEMIRSTFEGAKKHLKGKRPFVLTRAGYAGLQRFSAKWTGDNVSHDAAMFSDVRLINSLGLSGVSFAGADVGGFVGESTPALFQRWVALGAFTPFYRCHTMINTRDAEPWAFGEETEEISRNYIKLRYRMLPYLYAIFEDSTRTGIPISRSLAIDYTFDDNVYFYLFQNEFLFGPNLLVCPVSSSQDIHKLYLPEGAWYDLYNDHPYEGSQAILMETPKDKQPVFVKAGGILLMQETVAHTSQKPQPILEVHVYAGPEGSVFGYYEDDGETYNFEQGDFYRRKLVFEPQNRQLHFEAKEGTYASHFEQAQIFFHGYPAEELSVRYQDQDVEIHVDDYRFVEPISNFDPFEKREDYSKTIRNLASAFVPWTKEGVMVHF